MDHHCHLLSLNRHAQMVWYLIYHLMVPHLLWYNIWITTLYYIIIIMVINSSIFKWKDLMMKCRYYDLCVVKITLSIERRRWYAGNGAEWVLPMKMDDSYRNPLKVHYFKNLEQLRTELWKNEFKECFIL